MSSSYTSPRIGTKSFSLVANAFLQAEDLPFRDVPHGRGDPRGVCRRERLLR